MYSKLAFILMFLCSSVLNAEDAYKYSGFIDNFNAEEGTVIIDSKNYTLSPNVQINGITKRGEFGPIIPDGKLIGFNINRRSDDSQVTEIWLIN